MDVLTQGLLGAAVAQARAKKHEVKLATAIGFVSGLLADADVLIRSSVDPLLTIEYHRHFTHSIFFIPFGALIACLLLYPLLRNNIQFKPLYYYAFLGYLFSGTLDLFTSYGTYWLWPLLNERLALHIIGIVDLFFTPVLLCAVILAYLKSKSKVAVLGLSICCLYLCLGYLQLQRATSISEELAVDRNHEAGRLLVKPSPGTLFLWRSIYEYKNKYYVDAIHVSWKQKIYEGSSIDKYVTENELPKLKQDSRLFKDIKRFTKFSDGYIALANNQENVIGDMRYAMLPNSLEPLWGITINPSQQEQHVKYEFYRRMNKQRREEFINMMLGRDVY